jgi:hypothetical protein
MESIIPNLLTRFARLISPAPGWPAPHGSDIQSTAMKAGSDLRVRLRFA